MKLSEIAPAVGLLGVFGTVAIGFAVMTASAEHNKDETAHPSIISTIKENKSGIGLIELQLRQIKEVNQLIRDQNKEDHDRMFALLEKVAAKQ